MPTLVVEKGSDKGKSIPITPNQTVIIGRDTSTALPLRDHMTSRMHFKIESRDDGYWLHDLESMNGTYLNGGKIKLPMKLEVGDLVKVGETLFTFLADGAAATTMAGQTMVGYRIIERVGRGGMGTVYKAEQIDLQRIVALKIISDEHVKDKEFVDLFIHEARAAAKLNHPNIVQVYDVKKHGESYFFSMEFVSGGSVQDLLNKQRKVSVGDGVRMIIDAARGLEYAHKKGIVHRDVKPDNFMISETGSIKIGDMGLARGLDEKVGPEEETSVIGTPHYIAPEQVLGRQADFRSDVYSLGATLFRMVTGVTPFHAAGIRELVNRKVREEAPPAHEHNPEIPKVLSGIIARMMAREPEKRTASMGEVVAALERFQRGGADGTGELRQASRPIEKLTAGKRGLAIAAAAIVLVAASVGIWIAFRGSDPGPSIDGPRAADPEAARQALNLAMLFDRTRMDKSSPRSIEEGIKEYQAVVDKYPGTSEAVKAADYRKSLDRMHRDVAAEKRFQILEAEEIGAHRRVVEAFQSGRLDLSAVDQAAAAMKAYAADGTSKGTPAAEKAAASAEEIVRWKDRMSGQSERYERAQAQARTDAEKGRWRDAWAALAEVRDGVRRLETGGGATKERYRELFYDELAGKEMDRIGALARAAWAKTDGEARALARDRGYEAALKLVEAAIRDSTDDVIATAKMLKESLESEWAMVVRRDVEERDAKEAEARKKSIETFSAESRAARDLFLKFDFKSAQLRMKALAESTMSEELRLRAERRAGELERVAHLKDTLVSVIKAPNNPYRFRMEFSPTPGIEGLIEEVDERGLGIKLSTGGTTQYGWTQFSGPAGFLRFLRDHWKYSVNQRKDAREQCDIIAFCIEAGLYEDALVEIDLVLIAYKDPGYTGAESLRKYCEEYRGRLERGESAEHEEIEAEKRVERLDGFMLRQEYGKGRAEIDVLKAKYGRTKTFGARQTVIEQHLQKIDKDGGDSLKKSFREDRHRAVLARVAEERSAAKRAQVDVVARLGRFEDLFQRNTHLGAAYAAGGDLKQSSERLLEARRVGEQMLARREVESEFLPVLGQVYTDLLRNAVIQKEKNLFEAVKADGSKRFINPETRVEETWWTSSVDALSGWGETVLPMEMLKIQRLRDDLKVAPDDPQKIWSLAQSLAEGTANVAEARGYYAYLLENHADFAQVQNGNCLYRYAEILYAAREVKEAIRRFHEMTMVAKDHPKVTDTAAANGVRRRLDEAYKLHGKMGYVLKDGKK